MYGRLQANTKRIQRPSSSETLVAFFEKNFEIFVLVHPDHIEAGFLTKENMVKKAYPNELEIGTWCTDRVREPELRCHEIEKNDEHSLWATTKSRKRIASLVFGKEEWKYIWTSNDVAVIEILKKKFQTTHAVTCNVRIIERLCFYFSLFLTFHFSESDKNIFKVFFLVPFSYSAHFCTSGIVHCLNIFTFLFRQFRCQSIFVNSR